MKPIWYFVGILLLVVGCIVALTGIVEYFYPPEHQPILARLHTNLWWGAVMVAAGLVLFLANRKKTVT